MPNEPKASRANRLMNGAASRYGLGILAAGIATTIRVWLEPVVGPYAPYLPFVLAVIVTARFAGRGPSLLSAVLSALLAWYLFLEPRYSFRIGEPAAIANLTLFLVVSVTIGLLVGQLRVALLKSRQGEDLLRQSEGRVRQKLESIVSPDMEIGELELPDIIDAEAIQSLMDDFYKLCRVPSAIIDTKGNVLVGAGWQQICTRFHRVHPATLTNCIESDTQLTSGIPPCEYKLYKCKNSLWDVATPFIVGGRHLGNVFTGQFLLADEPVDPAAFKTQARRYGFDEEAYLEAFRAVPHLNRETVDTAISFLGKFGDLVGKLSYANIKLAKSITELQRVQEMVSRVSEQRRMALEAANLGAWDCCFDTNEIVCDERSREILGLAAGGPVHYEDALSRIHPDDRKDVAESIQQALQGSNRGSYHREFRVVRPDGSVYWVASHGRVHFEAGGVLRRAVRFVGVSADITGRKRAENEIRQLNATLERRVEERTSQLQEANRELEAFSYSVSHDLRAPLRSIEGFAKILLRDYSGKVLDDTAADFMCRMSAATQRMGQLIEDLLALSRLARQDMTRQRVDLSELAGGLLEEYRNREPGRRVHIHIQPGLVANADPQLARVAIENLLGNAWKYTGKVGTAQIEFGAIRDQPNQGYFIRDNGAGFDMAYADQLFAPFQRLHRSDEFEGNGIGLATVQRIVRRHGGRIWAEAQPGQGAVFYFTLGEA